MSSPNNAFADANGDIFVLPGDRLPAVPSQRLKAGLEYSATPAWSLGADLDLTGRQYLAGDASNQNPLLPTYWTVNLRTSNQLDAHYQIYGLLQNVFDRHYLVSGTFFDPRISAFLA